MIRTVNTTLNLRIRDTVALSDPTIRTPKSTSITEKNGISPNNVRLLVLFSDLTEVTKQLKLGKVSKASRTAKPNKVNSVKKSRRGGMNKEASEKIEVKATVPKRKRAKAKRLKGTKVKIQNSKSTKVMRPGQPSKHLTYSNLNYTQGVKSDESNDERSRYFTCVVS